MEYIAEPLSRNNLRTFALRLRETFDLHQELYFPVMSFLEHVMPSICEGFHYEIVPGHDLPEKRHAEIDVAKRVIRIREDVYEGAVDGKGQHRMTIMHEIAHYLLLVLCGVKFSRAFGEVPAEAYRDPEWQAKALAGEIMCPAHQIRHLSATQIVRECGVSRSAAEFNLKKALEGGDSDQTC